MEQAFFQFLQNLEAAFNTTNAPALIILFALAVITDIGVPLPFVLDTILLLAAYKAMISGDPNWMSVIMIVVMLFVGRQVGSGILYLMSRYLGKDLLNWINKRFPSLGNRLDTFRVRLSPWATLMVVTGRLTPGLLQITSIASGTIRMRYQYFALGIALASLIYDGILLLLALGAAHNPKAGDVSFTIWLLITMVVVVCVLWPVLFLVFQRIKKKSGEIKA